ncbi:MAG: Nif11-like leader peptide family natural product precursor [Candidatus Eremiobacterota bacterium]
MSLESAKAFVEKINTDEDFRNKVTGFKDTESRMAFVKSQGFDFTADDIKSAKGELSDELLDAIAGGGCGNFLMDGSQICRVVW